MSPPSSPSSTRLTSIEQVELWGKYWLYAHHHEREVVVVKLRRHRGLSTHVEVAFWTHFGTRSQTLRRRWVRFDDLKRVKPRPSQPGHLLEVPAPSRQWVEGVEAREGRPLTGGGSTGLEDSEGE